MADPIVTVTGNLTADPTIAFTQKGDAVANFTIASNHRVKKGEQWEDGETTFYRASIWREYAENVAESLKKGTQVIAQGRLYTEGYEDKKTGEQRTSLKLDVDEIGPALRFATANVTRASKGGGQSRPSQHAAQWGNQSQQQGQGDPWSGGQQQAAGDWGTAPAAGSTPPPF